MCDIQFAHRNWFWNLRPFWPEIKKHFHLMGFTVGFTRRVFTRSANLVLGSCKHIHERDVDHAQCGAGTNVDANGCEPFWVKSSNARCCVLSLCHIECRTMAIARKRNVCSHYALNGRREWPPELCLSQSIIFVYRFYRIALPID